MAESESQFYIPLGACEICSRLDEVESAFDKYGWDDMTRSMPEQAGQLVPAEDSEGYERQNHYVKRCPVCGIHYQYDYEYEYLVNGSEDDITLTRLTPDESRRYLSDERYEFLIDHLRTSLSDPDPKTRSYAARSLVAHALTRSNLAEVERYLVYPDVQVVEGAVLQLKYWLQNQANLDESRSLVPVLRSVTQHASEKAAKLAWYLLKYVFKVGVE